MKTLNCLAGCVALITIASCQVESDPVTRTAVAANDLGVATIETQHVVDDGDQVFELRGLDAEAAEIAAVRMRLGQVADLPAIAGRDSYGSEIIFTTGGADDTQTRMISREVVLHLLTKSQLSPTLQSFVALDTVASTLDQEAHIRFPTAPLNSEDAYASSGCIASNLLSSPVADQCCVSSLPLEYVFVRPSDGSIISRLGQSSPCTSSSNGPCNGGGCFYGPNGFSKPTITTGTGYAYIYQTWYHIVQAEYQGCATEFTSTPTTPTIGNVTGTAPRNQGCPGSSAGDGEWDY
jgi:hypothetical protein